MRKTMEHPRYKDTGELILVGDKFWFKGEQYDVHAVYEEMIHIANTGFVHITSVTKNQPLPTLLPDMLGRTPELHDCNKNTYYVSSIEDDGNGIYIATEDFNTAIEAINAWNSIMSRFTPSPDKK
jgi:hypothetical protein